MIQNEIKIEESRFLELVASAKMERQLIEFLLCSAAQTAIELFPLKSREEVCSLAIDLLENKWRAPFKVRGGLDAAEIKASDSSGNQVNHFCR